MESQRNEAIAITMGAGQAFQDVEDAQELPPVRSGTRKVRN